MFEFLTDRAQDVIKSALDEAHQQKRNYVGTEDILMALLREPSSVAAKVLMDLLGLSLDEIREAVLRRLKKPDETNKPPVFEVAITQEDSQVHVRPKPPVRIPPYGLTVMLRRVTAYLVENGLEAVEMSLVITEKLEVKDGG